MERTVTIPARMETVIRGGMVMDWEDKPPDQSIIFEPNRDLTNQLGLVGARVLSKPAHGKLYLRFFNPSTEPVVIYKHTVVGSAEQIEEVKIRDHQSINKSPKVLTLPGFLEPVLKNLSAELSDNERDELKETLIQYQDVFAAHKCDLGCTKLIEHDIQTGDSAPIKQNPAGYHLYTRMRQENR